MNEIGIPLPTGRKSAFAARNREALVTSAIKTLARLGSQASIDDFAKDADLAVSTIYKHFENREQLVQAAILAGMSEWETWMTEQLSTIEDPLEALISPMRLIVKMRHTHPDYAQIALNTQREFLNLIPSLTAQLRENILSLAKADLLPSTDLEARVANLGACLNSAFVTANRESNPNQAAALLQIRVALELIGLTSDQAAELMCRPLPSNLN